MAVGLNDTLVPTGAPHKPDYSQRHRQKVADMHEQARAQHQDKLERVGRWVDECERARADGETEDLLQSVLAARRGPHGAATAGQVRQFARELRAYGAGLWTLERTRGYFRAGGGPGPPLPAYPDDIDDVPDVDEEAPGGEMIALGCQARRRMRASVGGRRTIDVARDTVIRTAACPKFVCIEAF